MVDEQTWRGKILGTAQSRHPGEEARLKAGGRPLMTNLSLFCVGFYLFFIIKI